MRKFYILFFLSIFYVVAFSQQKIRPPFISFEKDAWVDSVFNKLTLDEKIGQLIMVAAYSNQNQTEKAKILHFIKENKIGGLIMMQGGPVRQAKMLNDYQQVSATPLLVALDAEYGLGMRLDSTLKYPFAVTMGAMPNDSLVFQMGADIAKQCKRVGIHLNFAPVADVNNNPENPVIGFRSFGDNPFLVAQKANWFAKGMQSQNVLATAKHFPGHGDTGSDSHFTMPIISHSRAHLDSVELYPFKQLVNTGIGAVMIGHLSVPALDSSSKVATISDKIIKGVLQKELGFEGLVVSDAMNMAGISGQGNAEANALAAGVDLLEFVADPARTIASVKSAIEKGIISKDNIDKKCRKVLMVKRWVGLNKYKPIETDNISADLNRSSYRLTIRNAYQNSLTIVRNENSLIPLQRLDTLKIATVSIGKTTTTGFQRSLARYAGIKHFYIDDKSSSASIEQTLTQLKKYNLVIAEVNGLGIMAVSDYKLTSAQAEAVRKISTSPTKAIVVVFGNPYVLNSLTGIEKASGVMVAYQENYDMQDLAGQLIFGAFAAEGKLPVTINKQFRVGDGISAKPSGRFKFTLSDELGVDSLYLKKKIDELINSGLEEKAFPGCQVFAAKNGKVFLHESYGYHTFDKIRPVNNDDLYDLASVTKISAPLPALMYLSDKKQISVSKRVSDYWVDWKGSNKANITFADLLSHQARLRPGILFWSKAIDANGNLNPDFFSRTQSEKYPVRISQNLYIIDSYANYIYREIRSSPLLKQKRYVYSDLGFIILPKIIENLTKSNYETFVKEKFYNPLGASTLIFNPYLKFPIDQIVPTENDTHFRHEFLQGFVQDESAAMLGGISGNAGLFSTIGDMAKLMQMYLQYGQYGGERYISEATMKDWTKRHFTQFHNRRGYGFDKPDIGNSRKSIENSYPSPLVSDSSFGHTGFSGTFVWADPATGILFLFFTNRVSPSRDNNLLARMKLRVLLQQAVYEALNSASFKSPK